MDNAFALQLILKAEQDNALHKRSRGRSKEGRQSPLMSLLQMSRLYLRANCSRCFCCWWCSYKEIGRGLGVQFFPIITLLQAIPYESFLKRTNPLSFFTLISLSSILCSSYLKYSQCNVWRCCCGGTDLLIYVVLTWLLRSAAVCARGGALKSFAKQRPKSVKRPVHQWTKSCCCLSLLAKKKSVIDTNEHTHYGTL